MKKFLPLLIGSLMALLLFVTPGNIAKADSYVPNAKDVLRVDCGCVGLTHITGDQKGVIVANLLSSNDFKTVKQQAKNEGRQFLGADVIQVVQFGTDGPVGVSVFFLNADGTIEGYVWINGAFVGHMPYSNAM